MTAASTEHAQGELGMHGCTTRTLSLAAPSNIRANARIRGNVSNTDMRNVVHADPPNTITPAVTSVALLLTE